MSIDHQHSRFGIAIHWSETMVKQILNYLLLLVFAPPAAVIALAASVVGIVAFLIALLFLIAGAMVFGLAFVSGVLVLALFATVGVKVNW